MRGNYLSRLARRLGSGGVHAEPVDQRHIDYQRGFWAGAEWLLDNPEVAESALEKALMRQETRRDT